MTSNALVLEAVGHREPARIPFTLYLAQPIKQKLEQRLGLRERWECPPDDLVRILWEVEVSDISPSGFTDLFGCRWRREQGGYVFVDALLKKPEAAGVPRVDLVPSSDIDRIRQARRERPDAFIFYQFTACFGERLWNLRGFEQTLMDYLLEPVFVHAALDMLLEMHLRALDKLLTLPIDGVTFGDDFGSQRGLMISRRVFLEFFKPRLARMYERVRSAGKVVGHHSCGDNTELMGDFIDMGLQVFHPLQPEAMDIAKIKREFGKELTFRGGIGTQGKIVFGTPEEARAEVRDAVRILARGGGYLLETAKPLPEETPIENALAVIDEFCRVMNYRFD